MAHSVIIKTPIPTWEETVENSGLSKADQKFVIRLVERKTSRRSMGDAKVSGGTGFEFKRSLARPARSVARTTGNSARKKTNPARAKT